MTTTVPAVSFSNLEEDLRLWAKASADGETPHDRGLFRYRAAVGFPQSRVPRRPYLRPGAAAEVTSAVANGRCRWGSSR